MHKVPKEEVQTHVNRLQEAMKEHGIDAAFILQGADMFYLSGTVQDGVLCVPAEGEPALFVRRCIDRAKSDVTYGRIFPFERFSALPNLIKEASIDIGSKVGIEMDVLPVAVMNRIEKTFIKAGKDLQYSDISPLILDCRSRKTEYEKEMLRRAGKIACDVFAKVPEMIRPGMQELELASDMMKAARLAGHQGAFRIRRWIANSFTDHVVSGTNACLTTFFDGPVGSPGVCPALPIGAGTKKIEPHEPIMIDFVFGCEGYHVDVTRVFSIGEPDQSLKEAYGVAIQIVRKVESMLKQGTVASKVYDEALAIAESSRYADSFMGVPGNQVKFIGHGIGLEVDEMPVLAPRFDHELAASNVLAVEPKFFLPGIGGAGLENTYIVGEDACENITPIPEEFLVL
ncbi:MAG: aminopeptidase P family protein [Candidatus Coatesbacteria bacterium]|nr:aminopeptidase P family protein [Candidatus Coatesbacteria bacterium]